MPLTFSEEQVDEIRKLQQDSQADVLFSEERKKLRMRNLRAPVLVWLVFFVIVLGGIRLFQLFNS